MKPIIFSTPMVQAILAGRKTQTRRVIKLPSKSQGWKLMFENHPETMYRLAVEKAKYQVGDILWVRETWQKACSEYHWKTKEWENVYIYKADGIVCDDWRPSIHMPKEAARIFLKVTNVRAERLQDIGAEDADAEGAYCIYESTIPFQRLDWQSFESIWNSVHAKRGYGWETNPFVWVYEFETTESEVAE